MMNTRGTLGKVAKRMAPKVGAAVKKVATRVAAAKKMARSVAPKDRAAVKAVKPKAKVGLKRPVAALKKMGTMRPSIKEYMAKKRSY